MKTTKTLYKLPDYTYIYVDAYEMTAELRNLGIATLYRYAKTLQGALSLFKREIARQLRVSSTGIDIDPWDIRVEERKDN